jgi:signal transduction histidine kinase
MGADPVDPAALREMTHAQDHHIFAGKLQKGNLTNASKHGEAHRAAVEVADAAGTVAVTIRDDGHGFDSLSRPSGFGLAGMQERAELLNGTLEIRSAPGQGTIIKATFPATRRAVSQRTA